MGAHPQNAPCRRLSDALRGAPIRRDRLCRLFFTDDLHDTLSWVPASDKPHSFRSCFTHSSQVFFGRPGPFVPGTGLDLTLFISPLERMTCPNHLSRRSRSRTARWHFPNCCLCFVISPKFLFIQKQYYRLSISIFLIVMFVWKV